MELQFEEISNEEFEAGKVRDTSVPELDSLRANFPKSIGELKSVILKVISHKTTQYDDLVIRAVKELKEDWGIETTYQHIRYLVLSELMNRSEEHHYQVKEEGDIFSTERVVTRFLGHTNAIGHLYDNYGKILSRNYMNRFASIMKRNNIGTKSYRAYYKVYNQPGHSTVGINKVVKSLDFRKPYSIPALTPNLVLQNLIYIIDEKNGDNTQLKGETSDEDLLFGIDEEEETITE